jgi:membrane-bound ClpP family serine protease
MKTVFTIFVLLLDEIVLAALALFVLWKLGIRLSPGIIIALIVLLGICFFVLYKLVAPLLNRRQMTVLEDMIGLEGKVLTALTPQGVIKVRGEIWKASSTSAAISTDEEVIVVGSEGLKLFVRRKQVAGQGEAMS